MPPLLTLTCAVLLLLALPSSSAAKKKATKPPTPPPIKVTSSYCDGFPVYQQDCPQPTDVMFIVDASNSLNRTLFYTNMLDYLLQVYCVLDPRVENRAGVITFAEKIQVQVPMANYKRTDWEQQINKVKANPDACCSCCTPTAEAFALAREQFQLHGRPNVYRMAFIITDGVPSNNWNGTGNPLWSYPPFDPARYNYETVPGQAKLLKGDDIRLIFLGVPNYLGVPPDINYFRGFQGQPALKTRCVPGRGKHPASFCWPFKTNAGFPIVKDGDWVISKTLNVQKLIDDTLGQFGKCPPTDSPTKKPTPQPFRPTKSPVTSRPSKSPTRSPLASVDLNIILDRSNSMNWRQEQCLQVIAGHQFSGTPSPSACWQLFTEFATDLSKAVAALTTSSNKALGWAGAGTKGVRVNVWGFACANHQRKALTFKYASDVTDEATMVQLMEQTRTTVTPDGGTCPGQVIESVVRHVEDSLGQFPYQVVVLITDGVFYDQPFPARAVKGLEAYGVQRYAVGIAVPNSEGTYGLTPQEVKAQAKQLTGFVGGPKFAGNFFSLNQDGYGLLTKLAGDIAVALKANAGMGLPQVQPYTWCGWRKEESCALDSWRNGHCKWTGNSLTAKKNQGWNGKYDWHCAPVA